MDHRSQILARMEMKPLCLVVGCRFGTFGIYSFMFFCILKTLMEVLVFFIILIAAFAAAFCVLFQTHVFPDKSDYYPYRVSA